MLLVARVLLGVVLIAHGWQKFATYGLGGTAGFELVWAIAAAALVLVAVGPGRFSVDATLAGRRRTAVAAR